jgi:hypothetical protein
MKQFSLSTISLLCAAIAPLCADNVDQMISQGNNGNGNNNSQMSNQNQMNQKKKTEAHQKKKTEAQRQFEQRWRDNQITPVANPKPDEWLNPFITADYIYWKAYSEGLAYSYDGVANAPTAVNPSSASTGEVLRPKFKWESGFKIGLGNKFSHDGWDVYAQYTWLRSKAESEEGEEDCCVTTTVTAKSDYWLATAACPEAVLMGEEGSDWRLNSFNVLDLELGRDFYISKFLTLRPFGGLKFSWIHQKYKVKYSDIIFVGDGNDVPPLSLSTIPLGSNVKLDFKQREFGVGLRAGMDTQWYFCKWLGAYGDFALTALWNRFNERREVEVNTPSATEFDSEEIKDKVYDVTAVLEIGLGLFFEWAFCDDAYMLSLAAGWEDQIWFNQNNMIFLMNNNAPGNLAFQGFTLRAEFAF